MGLIKKLAKNTSQTSLASKMRRERSRLFWKWAETLGSPLNILDVGGTLSWWTNNAILPDTEHTITLYNLPGTPLPSELPQRFNATFGDARDLSCFEDQSFDIVFSNSVIEHVGRLQEQQRMAREILRVGKHCFIQTPNRFFPLEPHFLVPLWQFFPMGLRARILCMHSVGWVKKQNSLFDATIQVEEIRLLTEREMRTLFPDASLQREKAFGLTKSFMVYR